MGILRRSDHFYGIMAFKKPDLTPLVFFFFMGYTKKYKVYETCPANLEEVKARIMEEIAKKTLEL